jgi:hypothetical protein
MSSERPPDGNEEIPTKSATKDAAAIIADRFETLSKRANAAESSDTITATPAIPDSSDGPGDLHSSDTPGNLSVAKVSDGETNAGNAHKKEDARPIIFVSSLSEAESLNTEQYAKTEDNVDEKNLKSTIVGMTPSIII